MWRNMHEQHITFILCINSINFRVQNPAISITSTSSTYCLLVFLQHICKQVLSISRKTWRGQDFHGIHTQTYVSSSKEIKLQKFRGPCPLLQPAGSKVPCVPGTREIPTQRGRLQTEESEYTTRSAATESTLLIHAGHRQRANPDFGSSPT